MLVFKLHTDSLDAGGDITSGDVEYLMMILLRVCCVGCFLLVLHLFIISRRIAERSTKPIQEIINIANSISHTNLSARIPLPSHKDEVYELSETINSLLDRIEYAVEREKSFTSYASHEFRTPLAVLKGKMEVLIRKPRGEAEYREKVGACIKEVDKLNSMVEQLLILTRCEEGKSSLSYGYFPIEDLLVRSLRLYGEAIATKRLEVKIAALPPRALVYTDEYSLSTILNNLISNAVKYSHDEGTVDIRTYQEDDALMVEIRNAGQGIPQDELEHIFEKFYRSYASERADTNGFGLGLPIVKRFCSLLNIGIKIDSEPNKITTTTLTIPN
jgi:signal transduction histidine kinase